MAIAKLLYPNAFKVAIWSRWVRIRRLTTTFNRKAATLRNTTGNIVAIVSSWRNSSLR